MLKAEKVCKKLRKCTKKRENVQKCAKVHKNLGKCAKMCGNAWKCAEMREYGGSARKCEEVCLLVNAKLIANNRHFDSTFLTLS